ncbi:hypothetical protein Lal_00041072, partial [Lupinus albus]
MRHPSENHSVFHVGFLDEFNNPHISNFLHDFRSPSFTDSYTCHECTDSEICSSCIDEFFKKMLTGLLGNRLPTCSNRLLRVVVSVFRFQVKSFHSKLIAFHSKRNLLIPRGISCVSRVLDVAFGGQEGEPVHMAGRGKGTSQNVPNNLLAQMVAALQH